MVSKKADFLATSEAHDSSPNDLPQTPDGTADNSALIFVEAGPVKILKQKSTLQKYRYISIFRIHIGKDK